MRDLGQRRQLRFVDPRLEVVAEAWLEHQRGDEGGEIGVSATLTDAVQCALDLPHAGANGHERVCDGVLGVVVGVNAEMRARDVAADRLNDRADFVRHGPAVRVAEDHPTRPGAVGCRDTVQRVGGVRLVAVEEVFGIEHGFAPGFRGRFDGVRDAAEIVFERNFERDMDVIVPALGHEHDRIGIRGEEGRDAGIVRCRSPCPFRHAERAELSLQARLTTEKGRVGNVGPGIAAFDVIDAEAID